MDEEREIVVPGEKWHLKAIAELNSEILKEVKKQVVTEFAEKFENRCRVELKPIAWEYGQGAEDVLRIFRELLAEVTGK